MQSALHLATVGMGSNVGDREAFLAGAIRRLVLHPQNRLRAVSSLYETEPVGKKDQPWFLNCVLQMDTARDLHSFFRGLQEAELFFGRARKERWGPRELDLDLLFFDDLIRADPGLDVPHPGIQGRRFVLEPLCEIDPDLLHPSLGLRARELLERLADPSSVTCLHRRPEVPLCDG